MADKMRVLLNKNNSSILTSEKASRLKHSRSDVDNSIKIYRTNGINAFVIDYGLVGLIFLVNFYVILFKKLVQSNIQYVYTVVPILGLSFVWLFFSSILDIYLLYLMLVPGFINRILKGD